MKGTTNKFLTLHDFHAIQKILHRDLHEDIKLMKVLSEHIEQRRVAKRTMFTSTHDQN